MKNKVELLFMEKPTKLNIESMAYNKELAGAYAQCDTYDVHVFLIYADGDGFINVEMCNIPKDNKCQTQFDNDYLLDEATSRGSNDSGEFQTIEAAIETIMG
jgi:hypothetical protein